MDQDGRGGEGGGGAGGGGRGGGLDVDEVIHELESEELRKNIRKQFSKKKKTLGELKGKFKDQMSDECCQRVKGFKITLNYTHHQRTDII